MRINCLFPLLFLSFFFFSFSFFFVRLTTVDFQAHETSVLHVNTLNLSGNKLTQLQPGTLPAVMLDGTFDVSRNNISILNPQWFFDFAIRVDIIMVGIQKETHRESKENG